MPPGCQNRSHLLCAQAGSGRTRGVLRKDSQTLILSSDKSGDCSDPKTEMEINVRSLPCEISCFWRSGEPVCGWQEAPAYKHGNEVTDPLTGAGFSVTALHSRGCLGKSVWQSSRVPFGPPEAKSYYERIACWVIVYLHTIFVGCTVIEDICRVRKNFFWLSRD